MVVVRIDWAGRFTLQDSMRAVRVGAVLATNIPRRRFRSRRPPRLPADHRARVPMPTLTSSSPPSVLCAGKGVPCREFAVHSVEYSRSAARCQPATAIRSCLGYPSCDVTAWRLQNVGVTHGGLVFRFNQGKTAAGRSCREPVCCSHQGRSRSLHQLAMRFTCNAGRRPSFRKQRRDMRLRGAGRSELLELSRSHTTRCEQPSASISPRCVAS